MSDGYPEFSRGTFIYIHLNRVHNPFTIQTALLYTTYHIFLDSIVYPGNFVLVFLLAPFSPKPNQSPPSIFLYHFHKDRLVGLC